MILKHISITNYKNIRQADIDLSAKINCFVGNNGVGKTNFLDALYFLSFTKSSYNATDSQLILHDEDFFMIDATYLNKNEDEVCIFSSLKRGGKKSFKRNKKNYKKLSEHIGFIPLISISPSDSFLIDAGSEGRRHLMDIIIAQYDHDYIEALTRYNKALQQRNTILKSNDVYDLTLMDILEQEMARHGQYIYNAREQFIERLKPLFYTVYKEIALEKEDISLSYTSHCQNGSLLEQIKASRQKDQIMGFSLCGTHRDDLNFMLKGHNIKKEGSQGQRKTLLIALKLAHYFLLSDKGAASNESPILLLDDIFDKLDANRVEQIIKLVSSDKFGQIFITDTNREYLDKILERELNDYKLFEVNNGDITLKEDKHV